jgi:putative ABC transport system permease protein
MIGRLRMLWTRIRGTVRHEDDERDFEFQEEIEEHVRLLAERYQREGMTADDALRAARVQFGNTTLLQEDRREMQLFPAIESLRADLTYALRMLRKNPGFAAAAVVTLALGIGANTAIFSLCYGVLFKPLPYAEPGRIMTLWERQRDATLGDVAPANFVDWRDRSRSFRGMAAVRTPSFSSSFILGGQREAARLAGGDVSSSFFSVLGVRLMLGRSFLPEEDRPGGPRVAILSYTTWRDRFGADRDIAGKAITLDDNPYTVVGVLPADFRFGSTAADFQPRSQPDVWVPLALDLRKLWRNSHVLHVIARLAPGVTLAQAQAELDLIGANLAREYPDNNRDVGIGAVSMPERVTATVRGPLRMLLGAVGLVLLIACANVANLLLSRAAARQTEMAVRVALGAGRRRLVQQLLTESLVLAGIGGIAGLFVALAVTRSLAPHLPPDLSRAAGVAGDLRMLAFTAVISLATGILFGLGPLVGMRRVSAGESLKQSFRVVGASHSRLRNALAVAQISIAIILLIGAGLMAKSLWALMHVAPGFRADSILTARLSLPPRYSENREIVAFERELLESLRRKPGVQSAGLARYLPFGGLDNYSSFLIEGRPPLPVGMYNPAGYRPASAGYFETIGIPVLRGRSFTPADVADSPWVTVINESMARKYWGRQDPIGTRLQLGPGDPWRKVIGVVGDVLFDGLDGQTKPEMYFPMDQSFNTESSPTIVVRTTLDPGAAAGELRETVAAIDRAIPVDRIQTMDQLVSGSVAQPRFRTVILAAFSLLALVMASIGIYGVMNYLVIQRTLAIRVSMGATRAAVLRLVLGRAAALIGAGTCVGLAGSVALVRVIRGLLFATAPLDPLTFAAAPALLAGVALAASYLPASRATRVDPMVALRCE